MTLGRFACAALFVVASVPETGAQGVGGMIGWDQLPPELRQMALDYADAAAGTGLGGPGAPAEGAADAHDAATDLDRELDGAARQPNPGAPELPVSCVGSQDCENCYRPAYEQIARSRILLARAKALYDATHRFATAAQAMGDNLAPSTREAAFIWQAQKPGIARSLAQFDAAYDRKIADMIAVLRQALQEVSECEARFYNNPDWYTRFGFMYYEFMQAHYKRS